MNVGNTKLSTNKEIPKGQRDMDAKTESEKKIRDILDFLKDLNEVKFSKDSG